jgi:lipid A 4'-phosphatase
MTRTQLCFAAAFAFGLVLVIFPGLDLLASAQFHSEGTGFVLRGQPLGRFFNDALAMLTKVTSVALLAGLALALLLRRPVLGLDRVQYVFLILCLAIGPGLLANSLFKEHWGRARPRDVIEFGGDKAFTPALPPSDQCAHNCSFVSGDAAQGFFYTAIAFIVPRRRRRAVMAAGVVFGSLVGLERMMQGAHFLSDVVFAGLVVVGTVYCLKWLVLDGGWRRLRPRPG